MELIPEVTDIDERHWYLDLIKGSIHCLNWPDKKYRYYFSNEWDAPILGEHVVVEYDLMNSRYIFNSPRNNKKGFIPIPESIVYELLLNQLK